MIASEPEIKFPDKLGFLFSPYRYKVAHGGRGSAKSWSFGRALLIAGTERTLRILCTREVQKSIKDSVHKLLEDQIQAMGLGFFYEVFDNEIRGRNGTEFIFAGLANHTVDSIKSFEGIDRVWVEEAQSVSKHSWDILIPTIRKDESEIWVGFNPVLDTDETWVRFIENPPPNACVVQLNYSDNPWFPAVLEEERLHCEASNPDDYSNIWLGKCRAAVKGAIYATEVATAALDERIRPVPYDPRLKVHAIWDLGWNDAMAITLVQKGMAELRVIGYVEDNFKTLDHYAAELNKLNYNWGYDYLPHDGKSRDYKTGQTAHEILKKFGRKTKEIPNIGVENGIKAARAALRRCFFDKVKTERLVECLKRYRRHISKTTNVAGDPIHDEYSNGADTFRYLGVVADMLSNDDEAFMMPIIQGMSVLDEIVGY